MLSKMLSMSPRSTRSWSVVLSSMCCDSSSSTVSSGRVGTRERGVTYYSSSSERHGTTIICVRKNGKVTMMGDGQVSMGAIVVKPNAKKIRKILPKSSSSNKDSGTTDDNATLVGFAGSTADAFTLLERLESKLDEYPGQLTRSCVELAKGWRTDKYLRRLEASLLVADGNKSFELTGNGDVLESHDGILAVGSGSPYALGLLIFYKMYLTALTRLSLFRI